MPIPLPKKKLVLPLLFLAVLITLVIVLPKSVPFLNRIGILNLLRQTGLFKPDAAGYFKALDTQNQLYDFNRDGTVNASDYRLLMEYTKQPSVSTASMDLSLPPANPPPPANSVLGTETVAEAAAGKVILPSLADYSTDAFTGSVTSGYSFDLPPGPAGMTPPLSLSYSSGSVDEMYTGIETKYRNDSSHPYQVQAGIFGLGWNLNGLGYIARDTEGTLNNPSDDTYVLAFAGGGAKLSKESGDETASVWRTVPNLQVKVERYGTCKAYGGKNICRYFWLVTTGDGTRYTFGALPEANWHRPNDPDSASFAQGSGNEWYPLYDSDQNPNGYNPWLIYGNDGDGYHALNYKWLLNKVESVYHQSGVREVSISYQYYFDFGGYKDKIYVPAVYPDKITYGNNQIDFQRDNRLDYLVHQGDKDLTAAEQPMNARQRISKINVSSLNKSRISYLFEYKYGWEPSKNNDVNSNGIPDNLGEITSGQVIHSLLAKVTPYNQDPSPPTPTPAAGTGLIGSYYNGVNFDYLVTNRLDTNIDFDWGIGAPLPAMPPDYFSVRWSGFLKPPISGTYTFSTVSDDGIRVSLDSKMIIDRWFDQGPGTWAGVPIFLSANQYYPITVEYYERTGGSKAVLTWAYSGVSVTPVPQSALYPAPMPPPPSPTPIPRLLSLNKPVTASKSITGTLPLVNNGITTLYNGWQAGDYAPQWVEIDLTATYILTKIQLLTWMTPGGAVTHQIQTAGSDHVFSTIWTIDQTMIDNTNYEFYLPPKPARYIRIYTSKSPSWIAWNEISVFGY